MDEDDSVQEDEDESYEDNEMDDLHNEFYEGNKANYRNSNNKRNQDKVHHGYDSRYFVWPDNDQAQGLRPTSATRKINGI